MAQASHHPPKPNFFRISAAREASFPLAAAWFRFQPAIFKYNACATAGLPRTRSRPKPCLRFKPLFVDSIPERFA